MIERPEIQDLLQNSDEFRRLFEQIFEQALNDANYENPSSQVLELLSSFALHILDSNKHLNLVANCSPEQLIRRHILDSWTVSLTIEDFLLSKTNCENRILDIGTGAGLPGMVLAIARHDLSVTLLDSTRKKLDFLDKVISQLELDGRARTLLARAETLGQTKVYRGSFDIVTSRAVAHLRIITEIGLPLIEKGGRVFAQKTAKQADAEIAVTEKLLSKLGGKIGKIHTPSIQEGNTEHLIIEIEKIRETPAQYPRSWAQMKNECADLRQ